MVHNTVQLSTFGKRILAQEETRIGVEFIFRSI
jgi:hypothetical protein